MMRGRERQRERGRNFYIKKKDSFFFFFLNGFFKFIN